MKKLLFLLILLFGCNQQEINTIKEQNNKIEIKQITDRDNLKEILIEAKIGNNVYLNKCYYFNIKIIGEPRAKIIDTYILLGGGGRFGEIANCKVERISENQLWTNIFMIEVIPINKDSICYFIFKTQKEGKYFIRAEFIDKDC